MSSLTTIKLLSVPNPIIYLKTLPSIDIEFNSTVCPLTGDEITKCIVQGTTFNQFYQNITNVCGNCVDTYDKMKNKCGLSTSNSQVIDAYFNNVCVQGCWEKQWTHYFSKGQNDLASYQSNTELAYTCDDCTRKSMVQAITYSKLLQRLFQMQDIGDAPIKTVQTNILSNCGSTYDTLGMSSEVQPQAEVVNWMLIVFPILGFIALFGFVIAGCRYQKKLKVKNYISADSSNDVNDQSENYYVSGVNQ